MTDRKKLYIYVADPKIKVIDINHCLMKHDFSFYNNVFFKLFGKKVVLVR